MIHEHFNYFGILFLNQLNMVADDILMFTNDVCWISLKGSYLFGKKDSLPEHCIIKHYNAPVVMLNSVNICCFLRVGCTVVCCYLHCLLHSEQIVYML